MKLIQIVRILSGWLHEPQLAAATGTGSTFLFFSNQDPDQKPTVRAERRRRAEQPSGGRERAETPQRQETSQPTSSSGGGFGGSGGGGTQRPTGTGGLPFGKKSGMSIILMLIVVCVFVAIQQLGGGSEPSEQINQEPGYNEAATEAFNILPVEEPTNTPRKAPTKTASSSLQTEAASQPASTGDQRWLVMLYQDADDKILEEDIYIDLNEAEKIGSSDRVSIVAQFDRFRSGYQGDGDWTSAKRFYITQDFRPEPRPF